MSNPNNTNPNTDPTTLGRNALGVIVLDEKISAYLAANDPKALEQATAAFIGLGGKI